MRIANTTSRSCLVYPRSCSEHIMSLYRIFLEGFYMVTKVPPLYLCYGLRQLHCMLILHASPSEKQNNYKHSKQCSQPLLTRRSKQAFATRPCIPNPTAFLFLRHIKSPSLAAIAPSTLPFPSSSSSSPPPDPSPAPPHQSPTPSAAPPTTPLPDRSSSPPPPPESCSDPVLASRHPPDLRLIPPSPCVRHPAPDSNSSLKPHYALPRLRISAARASARAAVHHPRHHRRRRSGPPQRGVPP